MREEHGMRSSTPGSFAPVRVLLVSDVDEEVERAERWLAKDPPRQFVTHHIRQSSHIAAALAEFRPDVALVDLALPDVHRKHMLESLREAFGRTPVVVITGKRESDLGTRLLQYGAADVIAKQDLSRTLLHQTLLHTLERAMLLRRIQHRQSELEEANRRLEETVRVDPLTDLLNRRGLSEALARELRWSHRSGDPLLVLLIDLDDFKRVNDGYGHAAGDAALSTVARSMREALRSTDHLGRIGGDEFLVLLPNTRLAEGRKVAEKLRLRISTTPVDYRSEQLRITASIALAGVEHPGATLDDVLEITHAGLAESKGRGKNQVSLGGELGGSASPPPLNWDELAVAVLDVRRVADREIVARQYEVVSSPGGVPVRSDLYRHAAERGDLLGVDHDLFARCLEAARDEPAQRPVHVGLLPQTLQEVGAATLQARLREAREGVFCVDVSDQQILGDPTELRSVVRELQERGISVALSHVGFGRSSLESLMVLEPAIVKLDPRCTSGIARNTVRRRSFERLMRMLRAVDCEVVAMGVDDPRDLDELAQLDLRLAQFNGQGMPFQRGLRSRR